MDTLPDPQADAVVPAATADDVAAVAAAAAAVTVMPGAGPDVRRVAEAVERESVWVDQVIAEVGKVVIGQRMMVDRVLIGLLAGGHCLIEGVPGLAKTLTVKTLAQTLHA